MGVARPGWAQSEKSAKAEAKPAYALIVTPEKRVRAELNLHLQAPKLEAREWVIHAARLPELTGQTDVQSTLFPRGQPGRELSAEARSILVERLAADKQKSRHELAIRVEYRATLHARKLVRRQPGMLDPPLVAPLGAKARRIALAGGHPFDFASRSFQNWLDKHALRRQATKEGEIDFARRVFMVIKKELKFFREEEMDRLASHVCEAGQSDGGGLAIVFVAALRANDIPARVLSGRWAMMTDGEPGKETSGQEHIQAEFFAPGVGWVPADVASAVVDEKPAPEALRYFGNDPGDFLTMHLDTDLELDTVYFGRKTVEWLQSPVFWVTGSGTFEDQKTEVHWKVESEPLDQDEPAPHSPARERRKS